METKKLFIALGLAFICIQIGAQVKVLSNGKVGISTDNPQYGTLEIGKSGANSGLAIYNNSINLPPLKLYTSGNYAYLNFGTKTSGLMMHPNGHFTMGSIYSREYSNNSLLNLYVHPSTPSAVLTIFYDIGFDGGDAVKIYSKRHTDVAYVVRDISKGGDEMTFFVNGDGSVYSKGSLLTASDESYKSNINSINNGLNTIRQMRGVTYKVKEQVEGTNAAITTANVIQNNDSSDTLSSSVQSPIPVEIMNKIKAEKKREKAGFIAQELEEVFPEAVYTLPNGKKAIAYSEIIPLLVEAIKEQQNEIDKQQSEIDELRQSKVVQTRSTISDTDIQSAEDSLLDEKLKAKLYSNIPNPFKEQTTISFFIPETASRASIHIYNLQGKQIKQINIEERGNGSVVINGYELTPGMYMYTLIVDGKEIDTKKMILTE